MANRKSDPVGGGEKQCTIEIAYVKLTGGDPTVLEAVKAFSTLITRSNGNQVAAPKKVNALPGAPQPVATNGSSVVEEDPIDIEPTDDAEEQEQTAAPSTPKAPRKYTVPTGIAVDTEADMPVDQFVALYKLESNEEKYLALAAWLDLYRKIPLKAGLIVTLYNHLDWTLPADVTMPLRRAVQKRFQWLERTGVGDYQIHQIGKSKLAKLKIA